MPQQLTEHSSKQILERFGVPCPRGLIVATPEEAEQAATELGGEVVVKAQLPAGGRGKAGAILFATSPLEAAAAFRRVTTVKVDGLRAEIALVEPRRHPQAEHYVGIAIDAEVSHPVLLLGERGGVEVEDNESLTSIPLRDDGTIPMDVVRRQATVGDLRRLERIGGVAQALARAHAALEAELVEVNPLGIDESNAIALDARIVVDDKVLFRHPELGSLVRATRPRRHEDRIRDEMRLEYVRLEGSVGLLSSGAGMTMTAMDLIDEMGARPASFLDCSANPTRAGFSAAFALLEDDPSVRAILVNIFGGLMQLDRLARTLLAVFDERPISKPVTLRLMGTNIDEAERLLAERGLFNHRELEVGVAAVLAASRA